MGSCFKKSIDLFFDVLMSGWVSMVLLILCGLYCIFVYNEDGGALFCCGCLTEVLVMVIVWCSLSFDETQSSCLYDKENQGLVLLFGCFLPGVLLFIGGLFILSWSSDVYNQLVVFLSSFCTIQLQVKYHQIIHYL